MSSMAISNIEVANENVIWLKKKKNEEADERNEEISLICEEACEEENIEMAVMKEEKKMKAAK